MPCKRYELHSTSLHCQPQAACCHAMAHATKDIVTLLISASTVLQHVHRLDYIYIPSKAFEPDWHAFHVCIQWAKPWHVATAWIQSMHLLGTNLLYQQQYQMLMLQLPVTNIYMACCVAPVQPECVRVKLLHPEHRSSKKQ